MRSSLIKSYTSFTRVSDSDNLVVYKARHRLTGVVYCIERSKRLSEVPGDGKKSLLMALNASQALSVLKHANIVRFYNSWIEAGSLLTKLEYCIGGSLLDYLGGDNGGECEGGEGGEVVPQCCGWNLRHLHEATLTKVLRDIANALDYMHSERCMAHGNVGLSTTMIQLTSPASSEYSEIR